VLRFDSPLSRNIAVYEGSFGSRWQTDNTFPLQAALQNYAPEMTSKHSKLYAASRIKEVKIEKLAYFAASVFLRASAHQWRKGVRSSDRGFLGGYEEDFRMLRVAVPETIDSSFHSGVIEPCRGVHEPTCEHYQFLFLGIGFDLFVGKTMHDHFRKHCFVRGDLIAMTQILDHGIHFKWKRLAKGREIGGY
jgi:hypothetical protein